MPNKKGKWEHTFTAMPKHRKDGSEILYSVKEDPLADYTATITGNAEEGFTILNMLTPPSPPDNITPEPYYYKFTFTKLWQGDHEDSIDWDLYFPDGSKAHKWFNKRIVSENEWYYEAWFPSEVDCYLIEKVPENYKVRYENTGAHAGETDRCYNGGTIINYNVPKTNDPANLRLWMGCVLLGVTALCGALIFDRKKRKDK